MKAALIPRPRCRGAMKIKKYKNQNDCIVSRWLCNNCGFNTARRDEEETDEGGAQ